MRALGRLLRLSLAPSAAADIAAGVVLGAGAWPGGWRPFALMLASLCVYHGGMALNDWADRREDERADRGRPLQTGAIRPGTALALALVLMLLGPLLALAVMPRAAFLLALVSGVAALYDLAGRGRWSGPLLLGACRAGNLAAGLALGLAADGPRVWSQPVLVVVLYGFYVFWVSRLARLEDSAEGEFARGSPALAVATAAGLLVALGLPRLVLLFLGSGARELSFWDLAGAVTAPLLAAAGARGLALEALRRRPWSRERVGAVVGMALRRLLIATAALAAQAGPHGLVTSAAILCGYRVSFLLRRIFPPT